MMMIGESLMAGSTSYSPWVEAFGDSATFAVEVLVISSGLNDEGKKYQVLLTIDVQTKNTDDPDSAVTVLTRLDGASPWVMDSVGAKSARFGTFRQLVRFEYKLSFQDAVEGPEVSGAHFRMLPPAWQDNCLCCSVEAELQKDTLATF